MKTQTVWDFTPDEFAWVWAETGLDEYPYPISIIESPPTQDEYARQVAEISRRYPRRGNADLIGPLRVLADPEVRIICTGRSHASHKRVRSLAAAAGRLGVILFQKSGVTADFGGNLKLVVTRPADLGTHIAATMPPAPAGTAGQMIGYTPRVRGQEPPSSWLRNVHGKHPVEERIRLLLRAPRTAEGHLRIERHLRNTRPHPPSYLSWIDIHNNHPAAGRYVIEVDENDTVVTPSSNETIAQKLHRSAELDHV
ncbi:MULTISPECIES: ESX secretion-associated protein EspG [unclassified Nocardia]|uniref:ESX secretion-associated protein EspG n=1 Tax=unclassified Nocardia TaxID=2637762 RepID=UPI001CE4A931|nr:MULTISPECIES: ESX secretion-associated protein EspG [unclassified Nocardia]